MWQNYQISEQFPSREEEEALGFPVFARKEYWLLHLNEEQLLPILIHNQHKEIRGFWCFYRKDEKLVTPFNAPFFNPYLKESDTKELLLKEVLEYCKLKFNLPIQITLKSDWDFQKLQDLVSPLKILKVELGSQLNISNSSFVKLISKKRKRRKLNSLLADNTFEILEVENAVWGNVYKQNLNWRTEKGHLNFIGKDEMTKAKTQFPNIYHAFQLMKDGTLAGAVFFLKVDHDMIYVYTLITSPSIDSEEPSLLLWNALFDFAKKENISTIDMGTSMLPEGGINKSLALYKKFIGGVHYKKYTFEC